MKNNFTITDGVVVMMVQGKQVMFDETDIPVVGKHKWKSPRGSSVNTGYRDENGVGRTLTLHKLLTGSKYVEWANGNLFDYRRCNLVPTDKVIQHHKRGVRLKGNECRIDNGVIIVLINSKNKTYEAYADYEDYPIISNYTWGVNVVTGYAWSVDRVTKKGVYMHRLIMGAVNFHDKVDHINGNKIDNRKSNLRICNDGENHHNSYRHRNGTAGVSRHVDGGWDARIQVEGFIHRKYFKTYEEALAQRRSWEQEFNPSGLNGDHK
jgi:hypothetical protein